MNKLPFGEINDVKIQSKKILKESEPIKKEASGVNPLFLIFLYFFWKFVLHKIYKGNYTTKTVMSYRP